MKKKLNLKKETVAILENNQMDNVQGGKTILSYDCYTAKVNCPGCTKGDPCVVLTVVTYSCPESVFFCKM
ncbi:MAG: class I lanthipeptide [Hyphomicrobiales bacterium]